MIREKVVLHENFGGGKGGKQKFIGWFLMFSMGKFEFWKRFWGDFREQARKIRKIREKYIFFHSKFSFSLFFLLKTRFFHRNLLAKFNFQHGFLNIEINFLKTRLPR